MKTRATLALVALLVPAAASASNAGANALYARIAEAHATLDSAALEPLYAPGATYLPRRSSEILPREEIMRRERASHDGMRADGGSIELKFRITDRKRFGDAYVDNGYMRRTIARTQSEPAVTTTSKLILVMAK